MASTEASTPITNPEKVAPPSPPPVTAPSQVTAKVAPPTTTGRDFFKVGDLVLRVLLFSTTITAVLVLVTSKQTKLLQMPIPPYFTFSNSAKFQHSSAFIYLLVALSVAGLYSIITGIVSFLALLKPTSSSVKILAHFIILDVLMLGVVASATGASGAVAYIGLNGNSHVNWTKICNTYGKFCVHIGVSTLISLFASIVLALLVILAAFSLSKKIPR